MQYRAGQLFNTDESAIQVRPQAHVQRSNGLLNSLRRRLPPRPHVDGAGCIVPQRKACQQPRHRHVTKPCTHVHGTLSLSTGPQRCIVGLCLQYRSMKMVWQPIPTTGATTLKKPTEPPSSWAAKAQGKRPKLQVQQPVDAAPAHCPAPHSAPSRLKGKKEASPTEPGMRGNSSRTGPVITSAGRNTAERGVGQGQGTRALGSFT